MSWRRGKPLAQDLRDRVLVRADAKKKTLYASEYSRPEVVQAHTTWAAGLSTLATDG